MIRFVFLEDHFNNRVKDTEMGSLEADKLKGFKTHLAGISPQGRRKFQNQWLLPGHFKLLNIIKKGFGSRRRQRWPEE